MDTHQKQLFKTWITLFAASYALMVIQGVLFVVFAILFMGGVGTEAAPVLMALLNLKLLSRYARKGSFLRPTSSTGRLGAFLVLLAIGRLILQINIMTGSSGYMLMLLAALIATALMYLNTRRPAQGE